VTTGLGSTDTWRRLPTDGGSSQDHVRLSDALSRLASRPTVWWHWTAEPTLILGAGQHQAVVDLAACTAAGVRVINRNSGGTSVYADPSMLGLDVALPPHHPLIQDDVVESYRWMGEVWVHALSSLGITGRIVSIEEAHAQPRPSPDVESILRLACFGSLSPYEVVVEGRKIVGLSQVRRAGRTLLQSGIYLTFSAEALSQLLLMSDRPRAAHKLEDVAIGLDQAAGREIRREKIEQAFSRALFDCLGVVEMDGNWTPEEIAYVKG
jgi:lipoate-protein ligase A